MIFEEFCSRIALDFKTFGSHLETQLVSSGFSHDAQVLKDGQVDENRSILTPRAVKHFRKSFQKNLDVEAQAPVLNVIEIKRHARLKGWITPCSYLPQTSKTRFDIQPTKVFWGVPLKIIHRVRPWTHQTHVPDQHVQKLWQLIDARLAEPLSTTCASWIFFHLEKPALAIVSTPDTLF